MAKMKVSAPVSNAPSYRPPVSFFAAGVPQTKGSGKALVSRSTGRAFFKPANPKTGAWQGVVAHAAHEAGVTPLDGAVRLSVAFLLTRPKGHFRSGKKSDQLRESAPPYPTTKPDGDKLERAVLDALTGVAYKDDSQVAQAEWRKEWVGYCGQQSSGALVTVESLSTLGRVVVPPGFSPVAVPPAPHLNPALTVTCPACFSKPGEWCRSTSYGLVGTLHDDRVRLAQLAQDDPEEAARQVVVRRTEQETQS